MSSKNKKESAYDGFVTRYKKIPQILIFRTLENAESLGKAFDILEDYDDNKKCVSWSGDQNWQETNFD